MVLDDPDELLPVVDLDDRMIDVRPRAECNRDPGLLHRSVYVIVETVDGIVFQRRGFAKDTDPGAWDIGCAGHVGVGEDYDAAARRELVEELGIDAVPERIGRFVLDLGSERELTTVYRLRHDGGFVISPPEVVGVAVFPPGEMPAPLARGAREVLAFLAGS